MANEPGVGVDTLRRITAPRCTKAAPRFKV
jgi:hypothetical protein